MQDPNEDTEWNDILRAKGILPPKPKGVSEDDISQLVEAAAEKKLAEEKRGTAKPLEDMSIDELDELEDIENERALHKYRFGVPLSNHTFLWFNVVAIVSILITQIIARSNLILAFIFYNS